MTYAIQTDSTNRIKRWEFTKYVPSEQLDQYILVDTIPEGNLPDYLYIKGEYIYDPLPEPAPEPSAPTLEDRVGSLEATTDDMVLLMAELIGGN